MDRDFDNIVIQQQGPHSSGFQVFRRSAMQTPSGHCHHVPDRYLNVP